MRILVIFAFLLCGLLAFAQNRMNSSEIGYVYDLEHEFLVDHQIASQGTKYKVFLKFSLNSGNVKISDYQISYDLRPNYMAEKSPNSEISLDSANIIYTGFREFIYAFEFENSNDNNLVVIDLYNIPKNRRAKYDIPLTVGSKKPASFLIHEVGKNIPYFNSYLNLGAQVILKDQFDSTQSFEINAFEVTAGVPMPPFDNTEVEEKPYNELEVLYGTNQNEVFTFENEGYYKITASSDPTNQVQILVSNPYYPYFGDYKELTRPLIFLSTSSEFEAIQNAEDTRDGFEEFVQSTISNNDRVAKDFIKYYYRRIRKAARLFTTDKEGWKTDRGMIYLIFGDPLQVFRNEKTELWVYSSGSGGRLRFVFDIIENDGEVKYQLIRGKRYREDWMTAVTQWRSGRIIE